MRSLRRLAICLAISGAVVPVHAQHAAIDPLAEIEAEAFRVMSSLEAAQTQKRRVETESQGLGASKENSREHLQKHARALYRITRAGMLPLAGGVQGMLSHLSRVDRLRRVVERDALALSGFAARAQSIQAELSIATRDIEAATRTLAALQARKASIAAEQAAAREASLAFSNALPDRAPQSVSEVRMPEGSLRLHGEEAAPPEEGFATEHGQLPSPVLGAVVVEDASAGAVVFRAGRSGLVRAVAEGRVLAASDRAPYGLVVIVDHGDRYVTVYAGLSELEVAPGELVSRGARLGQIGQIDGEPGVRFEVRRGTERLHAREWLGSLSRQ